MSKDAQKRVELTDEAKKKLDECVAALAASGFGGEGPPKDTTFAEIEEFGHEMGRLVARAVDERLTTQHAGHFQGATPCPVCKTPCHPKETPTKRDLQTTDGEVPISEPTETQTPKRRTETQTPAATETQTTERTETQTPAATETQSIRNAERRNADPERPRNAAPETHRNADTRLIAPETQTPDLSQTETQTPDLSRSKRRHPTYRGEAETQKRNADTRLIEVVWQR